MSVGVLGREEPIEDGESGKGERREHQSGEGGVEGGRRGRGRVLLSYITGLDRQAASLCLSVQHKMNWRAHSITKHMLKYGQSVENRIDINHAI